MADKNANGQKPPYPGIRITANGNQLVSYHTEARVADAGIFYPITPSTEGRRAVPAVVRRGPAQRVRPQHPGGRGRGRARRAGRGHRLLGVRAPGLQLHLGSGHRVRHRAVLPRPRQGLDDGRRGGGAGPDQARPERALRPRRRLRLARHRLDHRVRQGRPAGGGPGADPAQGHRAEPDAGDERAGRVPHVAPRAHLLQARVRAHPQVPRRPRRRHRVPDRGPAEALRADPAPRAADDRPRQPRAAGPRAEPGALHAGRGGAPRQLHRADPRVPGGGVEGVRRADGPLLRAGDRVQVRGRRHRLRLARLGRREHRGGGGPPAGDPGRQRRLHPLERHPAVPRARGGRGAGRQEERHRRRADRRGDGRRQPRGARHQHRPAQGAAHRGSARRGGVPGHRRRPDAAALPRGLRARLARLPARARPRGLRVRQGGPGADGRQAGPRRGELLRPRHRPPLRGEVRRDAVAAARGLHRGPLPLHRGLGRHHHRQEPRGHHRRLQRLPRRAEHQGRRVRPPRGGHSRQREPEVRLGEEGRADLLLPRRRPRAHPRQLRPAPRRRRAVLRPQGVHPHQPPRRHVRGRGAHLGVGRGAGRGVGAAAHLGPEADSSTRRSGCSPWPGSTSPARPPTVPTSSSGCRATRSSAPSSRCRRCSRTSTSPPSSSTTSSTSSTRRSSGASATPSSSRTWRS